ncbi:MAG: hypothetical protein AB7F43_06865 [Bacteriovoracia bacterium]
MRLKYDDSVVAFLDVLGFSNFLYGKNNKEKTKNKQKLEQYFCILLKSISSLTEKKEKLTSVLISDSVVLQMPEVSLSSVKNICHAVAKIQADLAEIDIWLRGGISTGDFAYKKVYGAQILVGSGIANAYALESKHAQYPRVIVDPKIFRKLKGDRKSLTKDLLLCDFTDKEALTILNTPLIADAIWVDYASLIFEETNKLEKVIQNLREDLYSGQEHYLKYLWVRDYLISRMGLYKDKYARSGYFSPILSQLEDL